MKNIMTDEEIKERIIKNGALTEQELIEIEVSAMITSVLIDARKDKNFTQEELGRLTGVKQQTIARLEKGYGSPKVATISKILRPLGKKIVIVDD